MPATSINDPDLDYDLDLDYDPNPHLDICFVSAISLDRIARKKDALIYAVFLREINQALKEKPVTNPRTKLP